MIKEGVKFKIKIPYRISLNDFYAGMNMFKRSKIAKIYHRVVKLEVRKQLIEPVEQYPIEVCYHFFLKGRLYDCFNVVGMAKMIEDGLVRAGVFKNDSPKYIGACRVLVFKGNDEVKVYW